MEAFQSFAPVIVLAFFAWLAFTILLPLLLYNRVKGIERALWALVSQQQAERREHLTLPPPNPSPETVNPARHSHGIPQSQFGR